MVCVLISAADCAVGTAKSIFSRAIYQSKHCVHSQVTVPFLTKQGPPQWQGSRYIYRHIARSHTIA